MADGFRLYGPLLRLIEPETAHQIAIGALKWGLAPKPKPFADPVLGVRLWGLNFANPIGMAAGFDKNAEVLGGLFATGFGFVEVGTVTPRPQPGNPRPRLFRLPGDGALINRLGFNNDGQEAVSRRLAGRPPGIVGVNLGVNSNTAEPIGDYVAGVGALAGLADYLVINVSSPNTPGLRDLQAPGRLKELLAAVLAALVASSSHRRAPLLLKIAPDLEDDDKRHIAEAALAVGIDGMIATNTTLARPAGLKDRRQGEAGGLSGRPLLAPSTRVLFDMYRLTGGRLPLIGVGGVSSAEDAYAKIRAGASLVQLYTALVYHGPGLVNRIKRGLAERLEADGFANVAEAVGADHR